MNLDILLKEETEDEKYNLSIQHDSYMMKPILLEDGINKVTEKDYPFFEHDYIYISKHSRYAKMVNHNHSFVELNYMYSGSCIQYIDKQKISAIIGLRTEEKDSGVDFEGAHGLIGREVFRKRTNRRKPVRQILQDFIP